MASRMERYYNTAKRSQKNEQLYKQINDLGSYTNIEGVADISNSNEININKVKEMLRNRENAQKRGTHNEIIDAKNTEKINTKKKSEQKNYDLRDVLNKAKVDHSDTDAKYRNIKKSQYDILKNIKMNNPDDEELDELLSTLSLDGNASDDLGIFDELKSNTMVGDASSIKKVLKEAKESQEEKQNTEEQELNNTNLENIDRSFYTSSFNFSDKDFEDLRNLDHSLKTNNKLIKILIIVFSCLLAIGLLILIMNLIF